MEDSDVILNEILSQQLDDFDSETRMQTIFSVPQPADTPKDEKKEIETHTQWALAGNGRFTPVGMTQPELPAGIYEPFATPGMWGLELIKVSSDGIYMLPDMATEDVIGEIKKFWASEPKYRNHGLLYKRGIIMCGPPGGGKTVAVKILMNELVKRNGIVINAQNIPLVIMCLKAVRRIEPSRPLIVVFEDIDEIIQANGESGVLSLLDGENSVDNVVNLATTNFPDRLGARIINRPSRFDRRVYVGMPNDASRKAYLQKATHEGLTEQTLTQWVLDTKDMSIAHLRELVAAVYCLDQPYENVLERLKAMSVPMKTGEGFKEKSMGFNRPSTPNYGWA
jgi:hypothetical protein